MTTSKCSDSSKKSPSSNGNVCEKGSPSKNKSLLQRLIQYSEKIFDFSEKVIAQISDRRLKPRIPTAVLVKSALALFWARLGSLNALEAVAAARFWKSWLGQPMASADTMGDVHALLNSDGLRAGIHYVYERLKRNKALPDIQGLGVAVLDGHESHASYRRHCAGCLQRTIHSEKKGDRIQFYHRNVTLMLVPGARPGHKAIRLLLDLEPQRPGEDEAATALRLLGRVLAAHGKHDLVVLKDERRNIYQDVLGLFKLVQPQKGRYRSRDCLWWDFPELVSWPQVKVPLRVIRSVETYSVRRQLSGEVAQETSEWIWATTLSSAQASTERVVGLGHQRWDVENHGFNELVNGWYADHVYKHEPNAIQSFLLTAFLAYNLFHAFITLNLKPQIRRGKPEIFWARLMAAQIYAAAGAFTSARSP